MVLSHLDSGERINSQTASMIGEFSYFLDIFFVMNFADKIELFGDNVNKKIITRTFKNYKGIYTIVYLFYP